MQRKVMGNALFMLAFSLTLIFERMHLAWGYEGMEGLGVFLAVIVGVSAVLANIEGMGGTGFVVTTMGLGILFLFYDSVWIGPVVGFLALAGGVLVLLSWREIGSGKKKAIL